MISFAKIREILVHYAHFIGPGIMVSVGYLDPGNYSTAVAGAASYQYKMLFVTFLANLFAVLLQSLCIKLGSVTGLNLPQNCRKHFPRWLNLTLFVLSEFAIMATDLAEVCGTSIALNILFGIPLLIGVIITVVDILVILMFYRPETQSMKNVRGFEFFISVLVLGNMACFCYLLTQCDIPNKSEVFKGYIPSKELTEEKGTYLALGIIGATVMPHNLILNSGIVQTRLLEYDLKHNIKRTDPDKPSIRALKYCLNYSYVELIISLFFIATFVNSAILIVSGATLYGTPNADDADLFSIYELLSSKISHFAGIIFALSMLMSGQSAGITTTMTGQMVSEGFIKWSLDPFTTKMLTRIISIVPVIFVTLLFGQKGIADILNLSQVILSMILPIVIAPLIYFTSFGDFLKVNVYKEDQSADEDSSLLQAPDNSYVSIDSNLNKSNSVNFINGKLLTRLSIITFFTITFFNFYLIFAFLTGKDVHF